MDNVQNYNSWTNVFSGYIVRQTKNNYETVARIIRWRYHLEEKIEKEKEIITMRSLKGI
jgi:hypothetical protein